MQLLQQKPPKPNSSIRKVPFVVQNFAFPVKQKKSHSFFYYPQFKGENSIVLHLININGNHLQTRHRHHHIYIYIYIYSYIIIIILIKKHVTKISF